MDNEKLLSLSSRIGEAILHVINELEKEMARECIDYGQLTRTDKERMIDEWLFFLLFRVDVLLFTYFSQQERLAIKEKLLERVFAPLHQTHEPEEVVAVMKRSIDRFAEYAEILKRGGNHLDVYPGVKRHLQAVNPVIIEGTEGPKKSLYTFLIQKNAEEELIRTVRSVIEAAPAAGAVTAPEG